MTQRIADPKVIAAAHELGPALLVRMQTIQHGATDDETKRLAQEVIDRVFQLAARGVNLAPVMVTDPAMDPDYPTIR
jgi:hypothetical protein